MHAATDPTRAVPENAARRCAGGHVPRHTAPRSASAGSSRNPTRRDLLRCALWGAAGAALGVRPHGAQAEPAPVRLLLTTDLHYLTPRLLAAKGFLDGSAAQGTIMTRYLDPIVDALVDDVVAQRPDAFVCLGDLAFDGEVPSHEDLAAKFGRIQDAGVPVLVLPGNHDVHPRCTDGSRTTAETFAGLYGAFGREGASACDAASLSYEWRPREGLRLLMVDCNAVEQPGTLPDETLAWVEGRLAQARAAGDRVLSFTHQVLWPSVYNGVAIENAAALLDLYAHYGVAANFSGHVHVQAVAQSSATVTDVTTMALGIAPVQYACIEVAAGQADYATRRLDVEGWARATGQTDPNLLGFCAYTAAYAHDLHYQNALDALAYEGFDGPEAPELAEYAARLNCARYDGTRGSSEFDPRLSRLWVEAAPQTAQRYGYDVDPAGIADQNRTTIGL